MFRIGSFHHVDPGIEFGSSSLVADPLSAMGLNFKACLNLYCCDR